MKIAEIFCNKTPYTLPEGEHTGSNLRAFFKAEALERCSDGEYDLFREPFDPNHNDELIRDNDDLVYVQDGNRFYVVSRKING